jgi:hypothetical protein
MSGRSPVRLRPTVRLSFTVAALVAIAVAFLAGPSGLVSVWTRSRRARRLERDVAAVRERIAERTAVRSRLADQDSAGLLARKVFGSDSLAEPDTSGR